jgi:hypothetical protein
MVVQERRGRGEGCSPGVAQNEIMAFLLCEDAGESSEPEIRDHLKTALNVANKSTIRNHLEYLKTKGRIGLKPQKGLENVWFINDDPMIPLYVLSTFRGPVLYKIFRAQFFQGRIKRWYLHRYTGVLLDSDEGIDAVLATEGVAPSPTPEDLRQRTMALSLDAIKVSPTHFRDVYSIDNRDEGIVIHTLLLVMGEEARLTGEIGGVSPEGVLAHLIADLLIDFNRYPDAQDDIMTFFRRSDFRLLFHELFDIEARRTITRCLSCLYDPKKPMTDDERVDFFTLDVPEPIDASSMS